MTSIKLCDFGFSKKYSIFDHGTRKKVLGTPKYMAPE